MDAPTRRAWVDVDLGALRRNAATLARHTGRPLLPMVKADAYGLGAVAVCRALEQLEPWGYGVATLGEAAELREAGIARRILLFTPALPGDLEEAARLRVTPTLGDAPSIEAWGRLGAGPWHLAIDTGMHRAGVDWSQVGRLAHVISRLPPEGACTHFHSAHLRDGSAERQEARFREALAALPSRPAVLHCENSPGIDRHPSGHGSPWDLARPGVFLYGVRTPGASVIPDAVASVRARVVEVRVVDAGETVSYGATWAADGRRRVATLAIGYGDGYRVAFSNVGAALVNGRRVAVVGRVTMDMTMVDVTEVPCRPGDVATLLGRDGEAELDLNSVADSAGLLTYEVLVGLRLRMPRVHLGAT